MGTLKEYLDHCDKNCESCTYSYYIVGGRHNGKTHAIKTGTFWKCSIKDTFTEGETNEERKNDIPADV